jgi:hypothetical protein
MRPASASIRVKCAHGGGIVVQKKIALVRVSIPAFKGLIAITDTIY